MNKDLIVQSYKALYRYAKLFDNCPSLKFVLSDVLKSTVSSLDDKVPKWFSPEMRRMIPSLLTDKMNYIPSRSAIAFLEKQYQPLPIPQKEETVLSTISSYLEFCDVVLAAASKNYRTNLLPRGPSRDTGSVAFHRDEKKLERVGMSYQEITSLRDLSEGMLLLNYPTEFVSRNPFESVLTRDEILYITEIGELGVRGIILNPANPVIRKETKDGHAITVITTRNPEPSRHIFVSPSSTCSHCLDSHVVPLNASEVASVTPDWEGMMETNLSSSVPIVQFDSMRSIPYPVPNLNGTFTIGSSR
ncbi:hypothetical protein WA538_005794 [Blastocystis sp. DL]